MTALRICGFAVLVSGALAGCASQDDSTVQLAARGLGIGDYESVAYPRTRAEVEAFPYAQLGVRLPEYPPSIFVLSALEDDGGELWMSADGVTLRILSGRIVAFSGMSPSFRQQLDVDPLHQALGAGELPQTGRYQKQVVVEDGPARQLSCELLPVGSEQVIQIVDLERTVQQYEERCIGEGGTGVSRFAVSVQRPYVWSSEQRPVPGLPVIRLDVLKRPG